MPREDNIAAVAQLRPIVQTRDWDRLREVFAANVVDHADVEGQPAGLEGIKWFWRTFTAAFPDRAFNTLVTCADDQHVTAVVELSGTHTGEWQGHAPTERTFSIRMISTCKFADGFAVERWIVIDFLGLLRQLGLV